MCFYFLFFLHFSSTKSYLMRETETHSPHPVNFPEWRSCVQPGDAFLPLTTERRAKWEKRGTAYLLRAGPGRFAQCLQTSVNKRHIATQIASFKFPHTEQTSYSSSSAVGKRAIVRPKRCALRNRWMDGGREGTG